MLAVLEPGHRAPAVGVGGGTRIPCISHPCLQLLNKLSVRPMAERRLMKDSASRQCCTRDVQGAVTLLTMAVPIIFSLLALLRVEHHRSAQHDRLHHDRDVVTRQTALLDEGQPLGIPQETLQVGAAEA